jgi:hypothetical protein
MFSKEIFFRKNIVFIILTPIEDAVKIRKFNASNE